MFTASTPHSRLLAWLAVLGLLLAGAPAAQVEDGAINSTSEIASSNSLARQFVAIHCLTSHTPALLQLVKVWSFASRQDAIIAKASLGFARDGIKPLQQAFIFSRRPLLVGVVELRV